MDFNNRAIQFPREYKPQLIVVIDTEEEFDWSAPADRNETAVTAMGFIDRIQGVFDHYGIRPCYVVDYPVVTQLEGREKLLEIFRSGRCEIGSHLHPWVTPPYDEELKPANTYAGNLDRPLELEKLKVMTDSIERFFGVRPTIYKAGRYGLGPNTESILDELGYNIDLSVCPPVDYSNDGGPDYSRAKAGPFWFGKNNNLLEIPITGAFVGWAGSLQRPLFSFANRYRSFKLPGIFSRLSVVDRLMLSPEGFDSSDHIKITQYLFDRGVRTFTWSFHSTSVLPGKAPYVQTDKDLERFIGSFNVYFDYFLNVLGGEFSTPSEIKAQAEKLR